MIDDSSAIEALVKQPADAGRGNCAPGIDPAGEYLNVQLATATPRGLQMLLYDGAIRLCRQALRALDDGSAAAAGDLLARARLVVVQLQRTALLGRGRDRFHGPLCELYEHVHRRLIEAGFYRRREAVSETVSLLDFQRPAWSAFLEQLSRSSAAETLQHARGDWVV